MFIKSTFFLNIDNQYFMKVINIVWIINLQNHPNSLYFRYPENKPNTPSRLRKSSDIINTGLTPGPKADRKVSSLNCCDTGT